MKKLAALILGITVLLSINNYKVFAVTDNADVTPNTTTASANISTETSKDYLFFKDPSLYFEFMRIIGKTTEHGADIGESIYTAKQVSENGNLMETLKSWHDQWKKLAERIEKIGYDCLAKGHKISARDAYLRATEYYRTAEFFLHTPDKSNEKEINYLSKKWHECFDHVINLSGLKIEKINIPYQNTTLPGYYIKGISKEKTAPTLIMHSGFDGTAEELIVFYGFDAVRRGYNFLVFEGPGQGRVVREQKLFFRPDWEKVVTPVVDFALTKKETDPKRIALYGVSMGGYLAPRAAAYEHRLAACIANGGIYDVFEANISGSNLTKEQAVDIILHQPEMVDQMSYQAMKFDVQQYWGINHGMWAFGVNRPSKVLEKEIDYNLSSCVDKITCPTLVIDVDNEQFFASQAQKLFNALTCPKTLIVFKKEEGADLHCQIGAQLLSNQRIFDWLDETLGVKEIEKTPKSTPASAKKIHKKRRK